MLIFGHFQVRVSQIASKPILKLLTVSESHCLFVLKLFNPTPVIFHIGPTFYLSLIVEGGAVANYNWRFLKKRQGWLKKLHAHTISWHATTWARGQNRMRNFFNRKKSFDNVRRKVIYIAMIHPPVVSTDNCQLQLSCHSFKLKLRCVYVKRSTASVILHFN